MHQQVDSQRAIGQKKGTSWHADYFSFEEQEDKLWNLISLCLN